MHDVLDAIVIGTGGVGSAALMHLASRGLRVVGLDAFPAGHDRGSSHGQTRIIRQAYFEHPNYVPLLKEAYDLWQQLEQQSGQRLYFRTGLLEVGPADGIVVPGVLRSAAEHQLAVDTLALADARRQFPGFSFPEAHAIVFEHQAGYLLVEQCVKAHLHVAQRLGAGHHVGARVIDWQASGDAVSVRTTSQTFHAARLIVTGGPWAGNLLPLLSHTLRVRRKHLHWYTTNNDCYRADAGAPAYFFETAEGFFYGFPQIDELGVKVAEHSGGQWINDPLDDARDRDLIDQQRVENFLTRYMPEVSHRSTAHEICYYTMTPDEHFIVDSHPEHRHVVFAAGLSGHGFKFTSVLGKILCQLAIDGASTLPIEFLGLSRRTVRE